MGLNGAFLTGDAFNLFVFFEVLLIASYGSWSMAAPGRVCARACNMCSEPRRLHPVPVRAGNDLFGHRHLNMADIAQKLPLLPEGDHALMARRHPADAGLCGEGRAGASAFLAARYLCRIARCGRGPLRRDDQGRRLCRAALRHAGLPARSGADRRADRPAAAARRAGDAGAGAIGILGARSLPLLASFAALASMGTIFIAMSAFTPAATAATLYYMVHSTLAGALIFLVADLARDRGARPIADGSPPPAGPLGHPVPAGGHRLGGLPPLSGSSASFWSCNRRRPRLAGLGLILTASFLSIVGLARAGSALFWKPEARPRPCPCRKPPCPPCWSPPWPR